MMFYKFRSMSNPNRTISIIETGELYCADWINLNDPMEGAFQYYPMSDGSSPHDAIIQQKMNLKVCALSDNAQSILMRAHYAEEFKGIAIGVEIDVRVNPIVKVKYVKDFPKLQIKPNQNPEHLAEKILSRKLSVWNYEKEWRIIQKEALFKGASVKQVLLGSRITADHEAMIKTAAGPRNIDVIRIAINGGKVWY